MRIRGILQRLRATLGIQSGQGAGRLRPKLSPVPDNQLFLQGIELLNDNVTPMSFVIDALMLHAGQSKREATLLMLKIHHEGSARVAFASHREAIEAARAICLAAEAGRHPLVCRPVLGSSSAVSAP